MTDTQEAGSRVNASERRPALWLLISAVVLFVVLGAVLLARMKGAGPTVPAATKATKQEATSLYNKGDFKKALPKFSAYVQGHPTDSGSRSMLASSYWLSGKPNQALSEFLLLLKDKPKDAETLYKVGILYQQMQKPALSTSYLRKAVAANSKTPLFRVELAKALTREKQYAAAVTQWKQAIALSPANQKYQSLIYAQLGDTYSLSKDKPKAKDSYGKALELDADNGYAQEQLKKLGG